MCVTHTHIYVHVYLFIYLSIYIQSIILLQRIDLRDNAILVAGLMALALSMKSNQNVTQLDLDDIPKRRPPVSPSVI